MTRPPGLGPVDDVRGLLADHAELGVHLVVLDVLRLHRAEGAQAHVEGHIADPHPHLLDLLSSSGVKCRPAVGAAAEPITLE